MTPQERERILVVDDEQIVLTSIRGLVESETDYQVETFEQPQAALAYLADHEVSLVLSDYLMPDMDGISFLAEVKKLRPGVPRVLLTGHADKDTAIRAINDIGLFQYVEKPWDNDDLLLTLRNGIQRRHLQRKLDAKMTEIDAAYEELVDLQREVLKTFT
jgi:DNA-binding NtrC family response regulator